MSRSNKVNKTALLLIFVSAFGALAGMALIQKDNLSQIAEQIISVERRRIAPDFTVTDIQGKEHRLSDYKGRNVMVVFWATWCPGCKLGVPHLIELREKLSEDELAIIAISNESRDVLEQFAQDKGINYTVATVSNSLLQSPYIDTGAIPRTYFVDSDGNIKLIGIGMMSVEQMTAVLNAP